VRLSQLPHGEVHVWQLDLESAPFASIAPLLSEDEQRRAARFHFDRDRDRWTASHGLLRMILGRYLASSPAALQLEHGPFGKPKLIGEALHFNLSHSGGHALVAVARQCEVGVDIERLRSDFSPEELAAHVFSSVEQANLLALPPAERPHAFLKIWTGKEAYTKARGLGLSFPLSKLTLRPSPQSLMFQVEDTSDTGFHSPISLQQLPFFENFVAALAVEGPLTAIRLLASGVL
jgi:4'-phosphopantetheinyl transferase